MMGLAHFVLSVRVERLKELEEALRRHPGAEWRAYSSEPNRVWALWQVRADLPEKVTMVVPLDNYEAFQMALKELIVSEFARDHGLERFDERAHAQATSRKISS